MPKDRSLFLIDATGALVVVAMLAGVGWYVFLKPDTASNKMQPLTQEVEQRNEDLVRIQSLVGRQEVRRREIMADLEELGRLPSKSPIDQDLRHITSLAARHQIKVLEVLPVSTVRYPNVLEQRYGLRAEGSFKDHMLFLQDFEKCSFWADVTFLKLSPVTGAGNDAYAKRNCDMTLSFYSTFQ